MHIISGSVRSVLRCTVPDETPASAVLDGRWLELEADIKGAAFDWRWLELRHVDRKVINSIQGRTLTFPDGSNHNFEHRVDGAISVTIKSKTYEALFVREEQKLIWSHGFVWIREEAQQESCSEGVAKSSQELALSATSTAEAKAPDCEMPAETVEWAQSQPEQRLDLTEGSEAASLQSQQETVPAALVAAPSQNGHAAHAAECEVPPAVKHWSAKQAQFSDSPPPPDGWIYGMSRSTGKQYYIDIQTGRTTYTMP